MMTRASKHSQKRTRAAEPASSKPTEMVALSLAFGVVLLILLSVAVNNRVPGGIIVGVLALLISAGMLAYWWKAYRDRGLKSKPRISFREVYVLYFGMSVEVGFIVHSMLGATEVCAQAFALITPPLLIGIVAAMDDTPYDRGAERRPRPHHGIPTQSAAAPTLPEGGPLPGSAPSTEPAVRS